MKEFLSIREVAEYLEVDYKTIYRLIQQGQMPAGKVGGVYRIRRQEVEAYFERQEQAMAQEAAKAAQLKCGYCLRLIAPHEVAGSCAASECDEPLCRTCWEGEPEHHCRAHVPSREDRLQRAQARLQRREIPMLLASAEARGRELLYLSRVDAKLRNLQSVRHPLTDRSLRISDWDAISTSVEELDRFREAAVGYMDAASYASVPTNPRRTYRLARDLSLEIAVHSDLATHLKQGFVIQPTTYTALFEMLSQAIGRAEAGDCLIVLGLAATAGWEQDAVDLVAGSGASARPFHHRLVAPVLVNLPADRLIYNRTDARLDQMAPLLSPEMSMDKVQEVAELVEALLGGGRSGVLLSEIVERSRASQTEVTSAFDRLAAGGGYTVQDVDKRDRLLLRRSA